MWYLFPDNDTYGTFCDGLLFGVFVSIAGLYCGLFSNYYFMKFGGAIHLITVNGHFSKVTFFSRFGDLS